MSHVCSLGIAQNTRSSSRVGGIGVFAFDLPPPFCGILINRESLSPLTLQCSRASRASRRALHHQINPAPTGVGISEDSAWRRAKACLPRVPGDRYMNSFSTRRRYHCSAVKPFLTEHPTPRQPREEENTPREQGRGISPRHHHGDLARETDSHLPAQPAPRNRRRDFRHLAH